MTFSDLQGHSPIASFFKCNIWSTACKTVRLCYRTVDLSVLSCLSVTLVYCGQTVGWIKMPLGTEVGLIPDHTVLDGDLAPPKRGHSSQF